jgi:predicted nucleic acid-binding protein
MTNSSPVFLDANVLVYALDQTSEPHAKTVEAVQRLLGDGVTLCTSHHVIEELLHVVSKIPQSGVTSSQVIEEIALIPNLVLIEPAADLDFARRYAVLSERLNMGVNDASLLQLMIDAGIDRLFSYDKRFVNRASVMDIEPIA